MVATRENFPLLAELLADQQRLDTPVARLAEAHATLRQSAVSRHATPIPLTKPLPGEQYAFEVDLDSCTGCKSCVAACHSLNGLDDTETWRDVGLLVSPSRRRPFTQTVTSACHHCEDPACLNGCPVLAYEKDPVTGIVRHLDDQCIGCSYCILKCPYDAPKFSARLGIVRKCDMCHGRLAEGEAPACVQACPTHAIRIVTVAVTVGGALRPDAPALRAQSGREAPLLAAPPLAFLPAAPEPAYTRPTTRYISRRPLPENLLAADSTRLRPQPPHWPLAIMLTFLSAAVGLSGVGAIATNPLFTHHVKIAAAALGAVGLAASVFHLGQPRRAWRIFLGWRKSWLSREALLFGAWWPLAASAIVVPALAPTAAIVGVVGLFCSVMIYVDTRRAFWRFAQTAPRILGAAALFALAVTMPRVAAFVLLAKLAWESRTFFHGSVAARLQRGPLARAVLVRDGLGLAAAVLLFAVPGWFACALLAAGELAERHLFFRAVDAPKMPGMPA